MPSTKPGRTLETSLYAAVKAHLERLGYEAKGEVCGCDIVAVLPGEPPFLVITELKLELTLELILQGIDRLAAAAEVWLAVQAIRRGRDRKGRAHRLCRLLGFGLIAVEPSPYRPRMNAKLSNRMISGDPIAYPPTDQEHRITPPPPLPYTGESAVHALGMISL
jgi:hypothetical protein